MGLVLSRKLGEAVVIDSGRIVVTVHEIRAGQVKLEVAAPREVSVHRAEIQKRVDEERAAGPK